MMTKFQMHEIDKKVLYLTDEDKGRTITNNIENILAMINRKQKYIFSAGDSAKNYKVIYKDTSDYIDEIVLDSVGNFKHWFHLDTKDLRDACKKISEKYNLTLSPDNIIYFDTFEVNDG